MTEPLPLTERQHRVLEFIRAYQAAHALSPTLEEVARHFGIHRVTVFGHVRELVRKGHLRKTDRASRSLRALPSRIGFPLLGRIRAGSPLEAFEVPETFRLEEIFPPDPDVFVLRVQGDSMIDDGIHDGDFVLVQRRTDAREGDTVVAVLDEGEVTLKRFHREAGRIRLQPANPALRPLYPRNLSIRGVMIGLVRRAR